jgi:hypothetical protein
MRFICKASPWVAVPDRRVVFQVVGAPEPPPRQDRSRLAWKLAYYLGRLGFRELQDRPLNRL